MSVRFFNSFKNNLFKSGTTDGIDFTSATIKAALLDEGTYTFSAAHQYLSDITGGARVGTDQTLASKTVGSLGAGIFNAATSTWTAVSGASVESVLIYKDTGTAGSSPLIAVIDQAGGLPTTPNGGDVIVTWDAVNGVLKFG